MSICFFVPEALTPYTNDRTYHQELLENLVVCLERGEVLTLINSFIHLIIRR